MIEHHPEEDRKTLAARCEPDLAVDHRRNLRPSWTQYPLGHGLELLDQRRGGILGILHIGTPKSEHQTPLLAVQRDRLLAEGALAQTAEPLDHMEMPPRVEVPPQTMQLAAAPDETMMQNLGSAAPEGFLDPALSGVNYFPVSDNYFCRSWPSVCGPPS